LRHQEFVGNDRFDAVNRPHQGVARLDIGHPALKTIYPHIVANTQRPLQQNHKATDIVGR